MAETLALGRIQAAADRIEPYIRRTPMIAVEQVRDRPVPNPMWLKLECLQVTGAFKARGAMNRLLTTPKEQIENGIVTASGGNHGLAVARAGLHAGVPTTIFLPPTASPAKVSALANWNADVRIVGKQWDEADRAAREFAAEHGAAYFHPFTDPEVIAGQGTVALEMLEQVPEADVYIVAIGGGGLIAGLSTVIHAHNPAARIIGVEPTGSPTIKAALKAGGPVRLDRLWTQVATMSCGMTGQLVYDIVSDHLEQVVLVEDEQMLEAAKWIWREFAIRPDLSAAAGIAALQQGLVPLTPDERICTLICGADDTSIPEPE